MKWQSKNANNHNMLLKRPHLNTQQSFWVTFHDFWMWFRRYYAYIWHTCKICTSKIDDSTGDLHYAGVNKQLSERDHAVLAKLGLTRLCDIWINGVWMSEV
jgi:hypothetical protein